MKEEVETLQ